MALADNRADRHSIDQYSRKSIAALNSPFSPEDADRCATGIAARDFTTSPEAGPAGPPSDFDSTPRPRKPTIKFKRIQSFTQSNQDQTAENYLLDHVDQEEDRDFKLRPRSKSHHLSSTKVPSRTWLKIQAMTWRSLMGFAINVIPKFKTPKTPKPAFIRSIPTSPRGSKPILLYFYTPPQYHRGREEGQRFPVIVDFHGGGFCLGQATDDCHWARVATQEVGAVVVGVGYRLAPEHPFPGAVDDSVDALLWLSAHAREYDLDMSKTVLSGFSAGANLAFAVPLRLEFFTKKHEERMKVPSEAADMSRWPSTASLLAESHLSEQPCPLDFKIVSVVAWYPLLDWTSSRAAKRRNSRNPKKTLPKLFTDLFDYSYLPPPDIHGYHCSPYASPALAPDYMLNEGLPHAIQLWLCEWDMLLDEGETFAGRLGALGKNVEETLIPKVPHGFDQSPSPFRDQPSIDELYKKACKSMKNVLESEADLVPNLHMRSPDVWGVEHNLSSVPERA